MTTYGETKGRIKAAREKVGCLELPQGVLEVFAEKLLAVGVALSKQFNATSRLGQEEHGVLRSDEVVVGAPVETALEALEEWIDAELPSNVSV